MASFVNTVVNIFGYGTVKGRKCLEQASDYKRLKEGCVLHGINTSGQTHSGCFAEQGRRAGRVKVAGRSTDS